MYETWVETKSVCQYVMEQTMANGLGEVSLGREKTWSELMEDYEGE